MLYLCIVQCIAVRCNVLQCVAVCCSMLQCQRSQDALSVRVAVWRYYSVLQCVAVCYIVKHFFAVFCSALLQNGLEHGGEDPTMPHLCIVQCVALCYSLLQYPRSQNAFIHTCCSVLQCAAVCCNVLQCGIVVQCVAVCCNVLLQNGLVHVGQKFRMHSMYVEQCIAVGCSAL